MSSSILLISINENMRNLLQKCKLNYKLLPVYVIPQKYSEYVKSGIELRNDTNCYTYKKIKYFEPYYEDCTGNEYTNNKIYINKGQNIKRSLCIGLSLAFAITNLLEKFSNKFNVVLSYNGIEFIVSFYCIRNSEEWLIKDLDFYLEEAIFVITTKSN